MPNTTGSSPPPERLDAMPSAPSAPQLFGLGALLVTMAVAAGLPDIDAPWLPGDEHIFIVRNPLVNPAADALEPPGGLVARLAEIATSVHEDLYQPLPIGAYAIEWQLGGGSAAVARRTDVAIHAINALIAWIALARLMIVVGGVPWTRLTASVAWAGAAVWALHPVLASAYAADMGRTHLLSATFSFLALVALVGVVEGPRDRVTPVIAALASLTLAMLCKPVAGWIVPAGVTYAARRGGARAVRSPLIWLVAALCAGFAALTLRTSSEAGLIEDTSKGLFGDPITRSAVGIWLYTRHTLIPAGLLHWYPPDPATGWTYWPVWAGLATFGISLAVALAAWRRASQRFVSVGWAWFWGHMLPVIGIVAAREAAATDRYLYQPLLGVIAILVVATARRAHARAPAASGRAAVVVGTALGALLLVMTLPDVRTYRSPLLRAEKVVAAHPDDPRAYEALAAAYSFAQGRALPADDLARVPAGATRQAYFAALAMGALEKAIHAPRLECFFPGSDDRAPFHRRLSYQLLKAGRADLSLAQAEIARALQPQSFNTWRRLAQAYRALERPADAIDAYARAETLLPDDALTRRVHFAEFGDLLISTAGRDHEACPKFAAALALEPPAQLAEPEVWREAGVVALLGAARCHIRFGKGADGFEIARQVLAADPTRTQAWLVAGEYHLRSEHFDQAIAAYGEVVRNQPAHYEALRGLHESLFQADRLPEAVTAWQVANEVLPGDARLAGFLVWACALAGEQRTAELATQLLGSYTDMPFACLAMSLVEWRAGQFSPAVDWVERAARGRAVADAREFERAAAGIRVLRKRGALGPDSLVLEAAAYAWGPFARSVRAQAAADVTAVDDSEWSEDARAAMDRVKRRLSDVSSNDGRDF